MMTEGTLPLFACLKDNHMKIVEVMEEYAGDCPQVRAEEYGGIEALTLWEISVVEIANLAVERAKEYLGKSTIGKADFKKKPSLLGETI